jgi:hypothetical protein
MVKKVRNDRKMGGCLMVFLVCFFILNSLALLGYVFWKEGDQLIRHDYPLLPDWGIRFLASACFLNVIASVALWNWKKWAFYLFAINLTAVGLFHFSYSPLWMAAIDVVEMTLIIFLVRPFWRKFE